MYKITFKRGYLPTANHDGYGDAPHQSWNGKAFFATKSPSRNNRFYFFEDNLKNRTYNASTQWLEKVEELT